MKKNVLSLILVLFGWSSYYIIGTADPAHVDRLEEFRASVRTWRRR